MNTIRRTFTRPLRARAAVLPIITALAFAGSASGQCELIGSVDTPGTAKDLAVAGTVTYVADSNSGLRVIDVSDPANPLPLGSLTLGDAWGVAVSGDLAYVADRGAPQQSGSLHVIDVSDPTNPTIRGSVDTLDPYGVAVSGTLAYVADGHAGLQVIDVSDPASPVIIGSVETGAAQSVAVSGTIAYVADNNPGLRVIDVSDPTNPVILGSLDTPGNASGVDVSGTVAYVASYDAYTGGAGTLQLIDVADPTNPTLIGSVDTPDQAFGVVVSGTMAYVADGHAGLQVIDVSDPARPAIIGSVDTPGRTYGVTVAGDVAYVADEDSGLQVIDVASCASVSTAALYAEFVDPGAEGWVGYDGSAMDTFRVYAVFDEPVSVLGVGDIHGDGINFAVDLSAGQLHNHATGTNLPPNANAAGIDSSLLWDTFVTVGETVDDGGPATELSPGFSAQAADFTGSFSLDGTGWYVSGYPAHADSVFDEATGSERVLIAQFTVEQGEQVTGSNWWLSYTGGGEGGTTHEVFASFVTPEPPCPMDFNGSDAVMFEDLIRLLSRWGACSGCAEDVDGNGFVGLSDLTALLAAWGPCP